MECLTLPDVGLAGHPKLTSDVGRSPAKPPEDHQRGPADPQTREQ